MERLVAVIFGSEVVAEEVYAVLSAIVTDMPIINLSVVPQDVALPAALHYMENGDYGAPIGGGTNSEHIRYVVRFTCQDVTTDPIRTAAEAAFDALDGHSASRSGANLNFSVTGEWPLTTVLEGGTLYRQLGFYLHVDLTQGS